MSRYERGDVVADIDKLVGKRGRSAFLTEVARDEIQRRRQRNALRKAVGAWKDEDHPASSYALLSGSVLLGNSNPPGDSVDTIYLEQ